MAVRGNVLVAVGIDTSGASAGKETGANPVAAGAAWTSIDGVAWRRVPDQPALAASALDRLTAGPAGFLGVGIVTPSLVWSSDGTSWTSVDVGTPNATVIGVAATDQGFVAVGGAETAGMAWTSPDGRRWERATFDGSSQLNARLLSVAAQGQRLVALSAVPAPGDETAPQSWTGLAAWTSSDGGTTWRRAATGAAAPHLYPPSIPEVYPLSGGFISFGNPGQGGVAIWSSPDGTTWRHDAIDATNEDWVDSLAVSGSHAVLGGRTVGTGMGGDRAEFWTGDVAPAVDDVGSSGWLGRAGLIIQALGYPVPADGVVAQERDAATGAMNTVVRFGTIWQLDWDPAGSLTLVFRTASPAAPVAKDVASARVVATAAALDFAIPTDSLPLTLDGSLWSAGWPRTVDGVPTIDAETGITLYADGSFAGFHRLERPLEPKPSRILTRAEAEAAFLAARGSRPSLLPMQVIGAELEWAPPTPPGIEGSPMLRLCWVLTLKPSGNVPGALVRAVLDAATGVELWGDSTA